MLSEAVLRHDDMASSPSLTIRLSLDPGEGLIWSGLPDPLRAAKERFPAAFGGILLLVLLPFAPVRSAVAALLPLSPSFTSSWPLSVALLLIALHLVLSPLCAYRAALRTAYVVTDRRLLSLRRTATGTATWSTSFHAVEAVVLRLHPDRTGDIIVRTNALAERSGERASGLDRFRWVVEARTVHELILKTLAESRKRSAAEPIRDYLDLLIRRGRTLDERRQA